jgi:hypothetical protein
MRAFSFLLDNLLPATVSAIVSWRYVVRELMRITHIQARYDEYAGAL